MHGDSLHRQEELLQRLAAVHAICDEYDRDCANGTTSAMAPYLDRIDARDRLWLLRELLSIAREIRTEAGLPCDEAAMRLASGVPDADFDHAWKQISGEPSTRGQSTAPTEHFSDVVLDDDGSVEINVSRADDEYQATTAAHDAARSPNGQSRRANPLVADDYELTDKLGEGGMGAVYRARQHSLNREVALKIIPRRYMNSPQAVARFYLEAETAAKLDHPNIVPVYTVGEAYGVHYYAMALVEGGSLSAYAGKNKPRMPTRRVAEVMELVARAVQHAHDRAIIHRDIKPANILLDKNGEPHLTDFGLAKFLERDDNLTVTNGVLGTLAYMAPEQADPTRHPMSTKADVYALGATLYSLLSGQAPFVATTDVEILNQVKDKEPTSLRLLAPQTPLDLQTICERSMAKRPQDRYASAGDLADDLRRWLDGYPIAARPVGPWERLTRWCGRHPVEAGLIGVAAAAMIVGTIASTAFGIRASREAERATANKETTEKALDETFLMAAENLRDEAGSQEVRREMLERVQAYYQDLAESNAGDPSLQQEYAEAQFKLGQVLTELHNFEAARQVLQRALSIQRTAAESKNAGTFQFTAVGYTLHALGNLEERQLSFDIDARAAGKTLAAWIANVREASNYRRRVVDLEPDEPEAHRQYASSLQSLGVALLSQAMMEKHDGKAQEAMKLMNSAQDDWRQALAKSSEPRMRMVIKRELARGFANNAKAKLKFADFKRDRGIAEDAAESATSAIELFEELRTSASSGDLPANISDSETLFQISGSRMTLGKAKNALGRPEEAIDNFNRAIRDVELVCLRNPQATSYRDLLQTLRNNLCSVFFATQQYAAGRDAIQACLSTWEVALRIDPDSEHAAKKLVEGAWALARNRHIQLADPNLPAEILEDARRMLEGLQISSSGYEWLTEYADQLGGGVENLRNASTLDADKSSAAD